MPFRKLTTALLACALAAGLTTSAQAHRAFQMGIYDPTAASGAAGAPLNFDRMRDAGAGLTRVTVEWKGVVPNTADKPAGFDTRNPADPNYAWGSLDAFVRAAVARGLDPVVTSTGAPAWAEGNSAADRKRRTGDVATFNPNPAEYGNFGFAMATRYSGSFPDPANPGTNLPRVRFYQAWNEPNFGQYLSSTSKRAIPVQYARMLNAFYADVKKVSKSNLVIAAGLGPYGNNGHANDVDPQFFMRELLCLTGSGGKNLRVARRCKVPTPHFDAWSQHPYSFGGTPTSSAGSPDGASMGNMPAVKRTLAFAVRNRRVLPRGSKLLWSTEMGWFSNPPGITSGDGRQLGLPLDRQAAYLSETAYRLWRNGFSAMLWYSVDDQPTFPSGLYLGQGASATPKPALDAFKMPFYADTSGSRTLVWGIVNGSGGRTSVAIEKRSGSSYKQVATVKTDARGMFTTRVKGGRGAYRARVVGSAKSGLTSLAFKAR
jgi:hypothetical protein